MNDDNNYLLLEQALKNHIETSSATIAEFKQTLVLLDERVKKIEMSKEKTDYQYEQIMQTLQKLNDKTIPTLTAQIEELKNKPGKRYEQVIAGIIGALAGSIGSSIFNIFKK